MLSAGSAIASVNVDASGGAAANDRETMYNIYLRSRWTCLLFLNKKALRLLATMPGIVVLQDVASECAIAKTTH